jgi:hypothetical protein
VGGADADGVLAERRIGRDAEDGGGEFVVRRVGLEVGEGEAGAVGDEFLEGGDVVFGEGDGDVRAALAAGGVSRGCRESEKCRVESEKWEEAHCGLGL